MTKKPFWALLAALVGASLPGGPAALSAQGPPEGIKVHGHWVIDVRQPDGALVTHREFENGLFDDGRNFLARALTRNAAVVTWIVQLNQAVGDQICEWGFSPGTPRPCWIGEPGSLDAVSSDHLTVATSNGNVILTGDVVAKFAGLIKTVQTTIRDSATSRVTFSGTASFTPVPVVAGQIIQVTVTISFS